MVIDRLEFLALELVPKITDEIYEKAKAALA